MKYSYRLNIEIDGKPSPTKLKEQIFHWLRNNVPNVLEVKIHPIPLIKHNWAATKGRKATPKKRRNFNHSGVPTKEMLKGKDKEDFPTDEECIKEAIRMEDEENV